MLFFPIQDITSLFFPIIFMHHSNFLSVSYSERIHRLFLSGKLVILLEVNDRQTIFEPHCLSKNRKYEISQLMI